MTDHEILQHILKQLQDDTTIEQNVQKVYADFVAQFPEGGYETEVPDTSLSEQEENALRELARLGYLKLRYGHHAYGWGYFIDLRGHHFHALKNPDRNMATNPSMYDSGNREVFETGAVRDTADGKVRIDLISPFTLERIGEWMRLGSLKYEPRNWEKGMKFSRVCASVFRHLVKSMAHDQTEDHLAAAATNITFLLHYEEVIKRDILPESLNDLPLYSSIPRIHQNKDEPIDY